MSTDLYRSQSRRADLLAERIEGWQTDRRALSAQEESGDYPRPSEWHASDDDAADIVEACAPFIAAFARLMQMDRDAFGMIAEQFSCSEIETIANLYRANGDESTAEGLIEAHAEGDEEGDDHYHGTDQ